MVYVWTQLVVNTEYNTSSTIMTDFMLCGVKIYTHLRINSENVLMYYYLFITYTAPCKKKCVTDFCILALSYIHISVCIYLIITVWRLSFWYRQIWSLIWVSISGHLSCLDQSSTCKELLSQYVFSKYFYTVVDKVEYSFAFSRFKQASHEKKMNYQLHKCQSRQRLRMGKRKE